MAAAPYAALVSLLNNLELLKNHPRHSFSFQKNQILSISEIVAFLIDFMESYNHSLLGSKEASDILETQIASAAYAAEDVIEYHVVDQIRSGITLPLLDLKDVIADMDSMRRKAIKFHKQQSRFEAEQHACSVLPSSSTPQPSDEKIVMVGFDDIRLQLMAMLIGEPTWKVIPIVGTGGIGKTTLARNVYKDPLIMKHFDVCLWATISQQYSVKRILKELHYCLTRSISATADELSELYKVLYGRRYLIILDDMWNVEVWDKIKFFFPSTGDGSRIIVTTRQSSVADYLRSRRLEMKFLDESKSWELFCQKASFQQGCPLELEDIAKKIVGKCKGLPLAVVVLAGNLGDFSRSLEYWENVANHMDTILNFGENDELFSILSLSYSHLPVHLKPCFLYMGSFKEDELISVQNLIQLWITEGFLKPNSVQTLEEIGEGYLKDLKSRNLVAAHRGTSSEKLQSCRMHDVLRELCFKMAEKEKFSHILHTSRVLHKECRRVVIDERTQKEMHQTTMFDSLRSMPLVRSLTWQMGQLPFELKLLRVMNKVDGGALSDEINGVFLEDHFQLVNLRYFYCLKADLEFKNVRSLCLPPSISLLWNLQTLIIKGFFLAIFAPVEIWEMLQLRHVELDGIRLPHPPSTPSNQVYDVVLQNLQTLLGAEDLSLTEYVCERIPNIKELRVQYHDYEMKCDDQAKLYYCPRNFNCFHKLETLICMLDPDSSWHDFALSLEFPSSLKSLFLTHSCLSWEELAMMVGSLPNLEALKLHVNSVIRSEWSPVERTFPRLKSLAVSSCDDLTYLSVDRSRFPVLENLFLQGSSKLEELMCGIGEIPTLARIDLHQCSLALGLSALRILVQEEEYGNWDLSLNVHFWGDGEKLDYFNKEVEKEGLRSDKLRLYLNSMAEPGL